jgi:hypothetical protein
MLTFSENHVTSQTQTCHYNKPLLYNILLSGVVRGLQLVTMDNLLCL